MGDDAPGSRSHLGGQRYLRPKIVCTGFGEGLLSEGKPKSVHGAAQSATQIFGSAGIVQHQQQRSESKRGDRVGKFLRAEWLGQTRQVRRNAFRLSIA